VELAMGWNNLVGQNYPTTDPEICQNLRHMT
jgi:hypothetical protein